MKPLWYGYVTGPLIGALWTLTMAITVAVLVSFASGAAVVPVVLSSLIFGAWLGFVWLEDGERSRQSRIIVSAILGILPVAAFLLFGPALVTSGLNLFWTVIAWALFVVFSAYPIEIMLRGLPYGPTGRHPFEESVIRFMTAFGYVFFTAMVLIPFYVMVMTSLKNQQQLLANPLDFTIDISRGTDLFRSYVELFRDFNFGDYLLTSFIVSVLTVFITLAFSVPGAYAVARLRFKGRAAFSRSILLIYMVPMIVLALPIYIAFSVTGLRNTIIGILMIYPVTTIPVAL